MDAHKVTHKSFRLTVAIAILLSALLVAMVSLLGRSAVKLHGALVADTPDQLTFAVLAYEHEVDLDESTIVMLPRRGNNYYAYAKDKGKAGLYYFINIVPAANIGEDRRWALKSIEPLHEGFTPPAATMK